MQQRINLKLPVIGLIMLMLFSCSKMEDELVLDKEYLHVTDLLEYCQGACDQLYHWENKPAYVKGYIKDIENENTIQNYFDNDRIILIDIRTGISMIVKISADKHDIFNLINKGTKTDMFYIKGVAEPLTAITNDGCKKGMVLSLSDTSNITMDGS